MLNLPLPKQARPHEVAIILLSAQGLNPKQVAHFLHYARPQPVRRVIARWRVVINELRGSFYQAESQESEHHSVTPTFHTTAEPAKSASWAESSIPPRT